MCASESVHARVSTHVLCFVSFLQLSAFKVKDTGVRLHPKRKEPTDRNAVPGKGGLQGIGAHHGGLCSVLPGAKRGSAAVLAGAPRGETAPGPRVPRRVSAVRDAAQVAVGLGSRGASRRRRPDQGHGPRPGSCTRSICRASPVTRPQALSQEGALSSLVSSRERGQRGPGLKARVTRRGHRGLSPAPPKSTALSRPFAKVCCAE